jgi:periplasmic divalent cation tolerance protein
VTILRLLTYLPSPEAARALASALLDARLIACANIGPTVESHYTWDGARRVEGEIQLWLKTRPDLQDRVMAEIARLHPYDCPLIAADKVTVNAGYAAWVADQTR